MFIDQRLEQRVDHALRRAHGDEPRELVRRRRADAHAVSVVVQDLHRRDVVAHAQAAALVRAHQRVNAARVVADHPAYRAVVVRLRVRAEVQPLRFRRIAQVVEHAAGLDGRRLTRRVDRLRRVHVLREIHDDRDVATLTRQARPPAAREHGRAELPEQLDRRDDVACRTRDDDADRCLAIVSAVRRIERPRPRVDPHLAVEPFSQRPFEVARVVGRDSGARVVAREPIGSVILSLVTGQGQMFGLRSIERHGWAIRSSCECERPTSPPGRTSQRSPPRSERPVRKFPVASGPSNEPAARIR